MEKSKARTDSKNESDDLFTTGTKSLQEIEENIANSALTFTNALSKGLTTYLEARKESANSKKDGAIEDMVVNVAKGVTETIKEASNIITDTAVAFDKVGFSVKRREQMKEQIGKVVNTFGFPLKD